MALREATRGPMETRSELKSAVLGTLALASFLLIPQISAACRCAPVVMDPDIAPRHTLARADLVIRGTVLTVTSTTLPNLGEGVNVNDAPYLPGTSGVVAAIVRSRTRCIRLLHDQSVHHDFRCRLKRRPARRFTRRDRSKGNRLYDELDRIDGVSERAPYSCYLRARILGRGYSATWGGGELEPSEQLQNQLKSLNAEALQSESE